MGCFCGVHMRAFASFHRFLPNCCLQRQVLDPPLLPYLPVTPNLHLPVPSSYRQGR